VLSIFGGVLLSVIFGLVALSQIKKSGGRLTGRGLAIAGLIISAVWIAGIAIVAALDAGGAFDNANRFHGEKARVAAVADNFESAADDRDYSRICRTLVSPELTRGLERRTGKTCVEYLHDLYNGQPQASLDVDDITVSGQLATMHLTEGEARETWLLKNNGQWQITAIHNSK
jgi:hypothetical protein